MPRPIPTALFLAFVSACRSPAPTGDGSITVTWTGSSRGAFSAPASGRWCVSDTLLEVLAVRNDTAVGFVLIAQDSARTATYPVGQTRVWTPGRPQANAGLRWLAPLELKGYEGFGGTVTVTSGTSTSVSGTIEARLRPINGNDTLQLRGQFIRIPIAPSPPPCGRANRPGSG